VQWFFSQQPLPGAPSDVVVMDNILGEDSRPIQPTNGRVVNSFMLNFWTASSTSTSSSASSGTSAQPSTTGVSYLQEGSAAGAIAVSVLVAVAFLGLLINDLYQHYARSTAVL